MERKDSIRENGEALNKKIVAAYFAKVRVNDVDTQEVSALLDKSRQYMWKKSRGDVPIKWDDIAALAELLPGTTPEDLLLEIAQEVRGIPPTATAPSTPASVRTPSEDTRALAKSTAELAAATAQLAQLIAQEQNR